MRQSINIDLNDVIIHGGVRQAIAAWCENSDTVACGVIGAEFSTSGPGSGWSRRHDATDYATRAIADGALYYLDLDDGRLIGTEEVGAGEKIDGEWPDDAIHVDCDVVRLGEWSDGSVVCIECPDIDDAIKHPALVAEMAKSVIAYHIANSDCDAWKTLIRSICGAASELEDIDLDDFDK